VGGIVGYVLLWGLLAPTTFATQDEREYLTTAYTVTTGEIFDRTNPKAYFPSVLFGGVHPFRGRSLFFSSIVAVVLPIHWKASFVVPLVSHLLTFLVVAWVCAKCGTSYWWAWLVLLHPTLTLYSRMVIADTSAATMTAFVVAFILASPRRSAAAGAIAGLSMFLRVTNCWVGFAAAVQLLIDDLARADRGSVLGRLWRGDLKRFLVPFVIFCVLLLVANTILYGGPFRTLYSFGPTATFGISYLTRHLPMYLVALNVFWPLMLVAVFFLPGRIRWLGATLVVVQLMFFAANPNFARGYDVMATMVRSLRYFMGSLIVLSIGYPYMIDAVMNRRRIPKMIAGFAVLGAVFATGLLFFTHDRFLDRQAQVVEAAYTHIPTEATTYIGANEAELFSPVFGERRLVSIGSLYQGNRFGEIRAGDFFLFYVQPPPRTPGQEEKARIAERMIGDLGLVAEVAQVEVPADASALRIFKVIRVRPNVTMPRLSSEELDELFVDESELPFF